VLAHGHQRTNTGLIDYIPLGFSAYESVFIRGHPWQKIVRVFGAVPAFVRLRRGKRGF
jgi:hypothetical protein